TALLAASAARTQEVSFVPATAAHGYAARAYQAIWDEFGAAIVAALEARTCLRFAEPSVAAIVADATSNSGGPEHPMRLRATYAPELKRSTLVHELGHRHLWQLEERLEEVDGHQTLYLILDLVWEDVWGKEFAEDRIRDESEWRSNYDYAEAWSWARSLEPRQRAELWQELLALNGFDDHCNDRTILTRIR
ncbi:MAG: hypothetical protein R3305_11280, partial [Gammaproteobacteria bacterium]|nr:hypothetical protein [Gammaproteobacteria bacterium]